MVGAKGPKMLRLAAQHADIWSWYVEERSDLEEFGPRLAALEAACVEVLLWPRTIAALEAMAPALELLETD